MTFQPPRPPKPKSVTTAYLLNILPALFLMCGFHRFYTGKYVTGALWFFTLGLYGVGQVLDLFLIPNLVRDANLREMAGYEAMMEAYKMPDKPVSILNRNTQNKVPNVQNSTTISMVECPNCGNKKKFVSNGFQRQCEYCETQFLLPATRPADDQAVSDSMAGDLLQQDAEKQSPPAPYRDEILHNIRWHAGVSVFPYSPKEVQEFVTRYNRITNRNDPTYALNIINQSFAVFQRLGITTEVMFILCNSGMYYCENFVKDAWYTDWSSLVHATQSGMFCTRIKGPYCNLRISDNDEKVQSFISSLLNAIP